MRPFSWLGADVISVSVNLNTFKAVPPLLFAAISTFVAGLEIPIPNYRLSLCEDVLWHLLTEKYENHLYIQEYQKLPLTKHFLQLFLI
jgi:hypothetical protein